MNDMTYNPKTGQIFATGDGDKKWIVIEDKTMTIKSKNCVTPASAIAYNIEKNQYAMKWGDQLIITDSNFKAKSRKSVFPPVQKKAPFLITQGMGTDGKYIYHVQFEVGYASVLQNKIWNSKQRNSNLLTVYDYNGNCIKNILISKDVFAGEMESMCVDADGNMFVIYKKSNNKEVTIAKIDMAVPTLTVSYSTTNKTNGNVKATIKANEVVQSVSGWTLSSDKKSLTKTYTSNVSSQKVTVKDTAGNTSTATIKISNIDKTAPTLNVSYSTTNKTNGNVKATIKANEVVQQVSGWTLSSDKKSLTKTYTSNVSNEKVTVKDTAGNTKTATINISNIDKTAPTLTVSYSTTNKTNGSVTATITANEVVQAVSGWTLSSDKKSLNKKYTSNVSNEKVTVKDTAGNTKTATINISNIDKVAPTITVSYSTTEATNGNVTATIKSNKEIQSVSGWTLSSDKKSLTKTYTSNVNNEKVIVKDIAGNASTATINISNIDKTAPKVTVNYSNRNKTKERVVVTITADEKIQEVEGWTLLMDQKNITKTFKGNSKETIIIKDLVGNKIEQTIEVNNIDKEVPIINVEYSNKEITNEDVTVRITANEEIQRIENWEQSEDRKTISKVYKENNSEEIIVKDIAGNEQPITVEVNNIDKVAPVLTVNYLALNKNKDEITTTITANEEIEGIEGWTLSEDKRTISKTYEENKTEGITVKDKAGNSSRTTISVTTLNKRFEVEEYVIENNNIKDVPANMSFEEFAKNIDTNMEYEIRENGNRISNTSIVKTGQMLIVGNSVYTIIVKGDTNKDGKVDILDIMQINRHRLNKERLTGASLEAGDVNEDENVNITDIMRINMYRLRKISKL